MKLFSVNTSESFRDICMAEGVPYHLSEDVKLTKLGKQKVALYNTTHSGITRSTLELHS